MREAGYAAAFGVSLPGGTHAAEKSDDLYALPRLGVGADFNYDAIASLTTEGQEYPEVASGQFTDVGPLAVDAGGVMAASSAQALVYDLDSDARVRHAYALPALTADRAGEPSGISALAIDGSDVTILQKAGYASHAPASLTTFELQDGAARQISRVLLPPAMNWLVGIANAGQSSYAIDDRGTIFDLRAERALCRIDGNDPPVQNRFRTLASNGRALFTVDTNQSRLLEFDANCSVTAQAAIDPSVRKIAIDGDTLYASMWPSGRRYLQRFTIKGIQQ